MNHTYFRPPLLAILFPALVAVPHLRAETVTWTQDVAGQWTDPTKWSSNPNLPGPTDDVVLPPTKVQGIVTLSNSTQSIHSLNAQRFFQLSNATLNIASSLQSTGASLFNSTLQNANVTSPSSAFELTGNNTLDKITFSANTILSSGNILTANNLTLANATLDLQALPTISFPGNQTLAGAGTILVDNSATNLQFTGPANATLTIAPAIAIQTGSASFTLKTSVVNQGTLAANSNNQSISLLGPAFTNAGSLLVSGAGLFNYAPFSNTASLTINTTLTSSTPLSQDASTAVTTVAGTLNAATFLLNAGTLTGTGSISGQVVAGHAPATIAPGSAAFPASSLSLASLSTNANTTLSFYIPTFSSPRGNTSTLLKVSSTSGLSLQDATIAISSASATPHIGFYKIIQYAGTFSGNLTSLHLPILSDNLRYTLDTTHNANFIDLHLGLLGDANDDGTVDLSDLSTILNNFGQTTSRWTDGNFDAQPTIDLTDLSDVLNNFGLSVPNPTGSPSSTTSAPVPEPASLAALLPALFLTRRSRRH